MPFTFKLSKRLARIKAASFVPIIATLLASCDLQPRGSGTGVDNPVTQVFVFPDSLILDPLQSYQFHVFGRTQVGDSVPVSVRWSASAGPISSGGVYTADTSAADVNSGVAFFAHVGGFLFGVAIAFAFFRGRRRMAGAPPGYPPLPERPDVW